MIGPLIVMFALLQSESAIPPSAEPPAPSIEEINDKALLQVRRIYVDRFTGGEAAEQIRDMIIASLMSARIYLITENIDRADAILKGSAEDLVYVDTFQSSDRLDARVSLGGTSGAARVSERSSRHLSAGAGQDESSRIVERKHEATASVRLVNKDGDVIWSTTQESRGGKFRGASADVADKVTRQLVDDYRKARRMRPIP